MGEAKGHKFGQALGEFCERAIEPLLHEVAQTHALYLDNGDRVDAQFHERSAVIDFLEHYGTGNWTPVAGES